MSEQSKQFWAGARAEIPLLIGVIPFGLIYGALALNAGLSPVAAQMMSSIVFAGSAQFITAQLVHEATPGLVIVLTIAVVNLRHILYSASLAPYVASLPTRWKAILSYLLTDEAYAPTILHYERDGVSAYPLGLARRRLYALGILADQHSRGHLPRHSPAGSLVAGLRSAAHLHRHAYASPAGSAGDCSCYIRRTGGASHLLVAVQTWLDSCRFGGNFDRNTFGKTKISHEGAS